MGSLQRILPEAVSEAIEEAFLGKLQAKIFAGANNLVLAIRAVEAVYGDAGVQMIIHYVLCVSHWNRHVWVVTSG